MLKTYLKGSPVAYRILMEVGIFLTPFILYGVYRLLVRDAQVEGRKTWPINTLFAIGAVLAIGLYVFLAMREEKDRDLCYEPARIEDGELVPARTVPCEQVRDLTRVGEPSSNRPGNSAEGVGESGGTTDNAPTLPDAQSAPDQEAP